MNIYIDFDGTLFDTNRFYNDFIEVCRSYNITNEEVTTLKNDFKSLFNLDDFALILKDKYHLSDSFIVDINNLYSESYLYDDAISFLDKYKLKYNIYLLTFGDYNYQLKKIKSCKIEKYFKKIIITQDKTKENIDYKNSIFIDNNPYDLNKLRLNGATKLIRIKHLDDPYSKIKTNDISEYFALNDIDVL